jgi:hypothetical protein
VASAPSPAAPVEIASGDALPAEESPMPFAERLQRVVNAQMEVIERTLSVLGPASDAEAERTARILATLSRTVQEIVATAEGDTDPDAADDDAEPRNIDEFRNELARRIRAFVEAEGGDTGENRAEAGAIG